MTMDTLLKLVSVSAVECRQPVIKARDTKTSSCLVLGEQLPSLTIKMIYGCYGLLPQHIKGLKQSFRSKNQAQAISLPPCSDRDTILYSNRSP